MSEDPAGSNPNVAESAGAGGAAGGSGGPIVTVPPVNFGCGASIAGFFPFVFGVVLLLRRRR